jgi:16S rRNA (cytosine1402-N4)-methyltransferase
MNDELHVPVLLEDTVLSLSPKKGEKYLDLTSGYGGHAGEILESVGSEDLLTLVDRDEFAVSKLKERFKKAKIINKDFVSALEGLIAEGQKFDMVLMDLGVSSVQLDDESRGFGFQNDSELDMRMDRSQSLTAKDVLNKYRKDDLIKILREYGDEPKAGRIASLIIEKRPLSKTSELEAICKKVYPMRMKKNPATKTFQAIRIEVNDEINQLRKALSLFPKVLNQRARFSVISFHSLEDGIVKKFFKENSGKYDGFAKDLKVLKSSDTIDSIRNLRSRSAILRSITYENKHN